MKDSARPIGEGTVDLIGQRNYVVLKEPNWTAPL
jgi:hypothetical protein